MRKLLLFGLILALTVACVCAFPMGAAAAEEANDFKITLDKTFDGEELVVSARLTENDGFLSAFFRLEFDAAGLTLESVTHSAAAEEAFGSSDNDNAAKVRAGESDVLYVVYIGLGENFTATGNLFTVKFRVKDGVTNGKHNVSLYVAELTYLTQGGQEVFNEKYSAEGASLDEKRLSGSLVAETDYFVSNGVPTPAAEGDESALVIILAVVAGVLVVGLIVFAAYMIYRKKQR